MGSRAAVLAFLALAACSLEGVSIEVRRGSTTATRVELYVVDDACFTDADRTTPCRQLKTPSASHYLDGDVYTRDDARTLSNEVDESDKAAHFIIRPDGVHKRIPLVFAVGFDDTGARVGAAAMLKQFSADDGKRHIVTLETIAEDKVTGDATSNGVRAETWYQDAILGGGCLAFEKREPNADPLRMFIVPADDLDCDGWVDPDECDAIWPNHTKDDDNHLSYTCVVPKPIEMGTACLLGDAACVDGEGPATCKETTTNGDLWCVPSALCDSICHDSDNPQCLYAALMRPTLPLPTKHPTYLQCKVPVTVENATGTYNVCNAALTTAVTPYLTNASNARCNSLQIGPVTTTDIGPFTSAVTGPGSATNGHTIQLSLEPPCDLKIGFIGTFPSMPIHNVLPEHVVKLDLDGGYSLVVPIVIDLELRENVDCQGAMASCAIVTADPNGTGGTDESLVTCAGR